MNAQIAKMLSPAILKIAGEMPPENFMAFFVGSIIGNTLGNLPDEYWQKCHKIEICSEPGCNCCEVKEKLVEVLDFVRDDFKKTMRERKGK